MQRTPHSDMATDLVKLTTAESLAMRPCEFCQDVLCDKPACMAARDMERETLSRLPKLRRSPRATPIVGALET